MKALITAGGKGTRLQPFTATLPKPLMPVGDKPVLEILLGRLRRAGVTEAILAVNHLRHLIEAFFGDGERIGMSIGYSIEDRPLGTAGPIGLAIDQLGDTFVVANGDLLTTLDIGAMIQCHHDSGADVTIGTFRRDLRSDFGILDVDDDMRMLDYREKPTTSHLVSMGIYVIQREAVRAHVLGNAYLDMPDLLRSLARSQRLVKCYQEECFWLDIGRAEDFAQAQSVYEKDPTFFG
jgi:NDP-sugar pyrophosphorylase family protein